MAVWLIEKAKPLEGQNVISFMVYGKNPVS